MFCIATLTILFAHYLPFVLRHLKYHPLPLHQDTEESIQKARRPSKAHQEQESESSDTESEEVQEIGTRKPLSTVYLQQQQSQRVKNHPNNKMSGRKTSRSSNKGRRGRDKRPKRGAELSDGEDEPQESLASSSGSQREMCQKVIMDLNAEVARYNGRDKSKKNRKDRTDMDKLAYSTAKHEFYKIAKYLNDKSMGRAGKWIFEYIQPKEFDGWPEDVLEIARKAWITRYKDEIRRGVNDKRTSIQQEMLKLYKKKLTDN